MENNTWSWNKEVHPMTVKPTLDCITELAIAAQRLPTESTKMDENTAVLLLQAAVRQMSVPLRKLCLEGERTLLQRVILKPHFLPVGGKRGKYSKATMKWRTQRQELSLGFEDGRKELVIVPEAEHEIQIGRLYGIEFQEDGWCAINNPFDGNGKEIGMKTWLETKVLQVNSISYTVRDALKLVADFEGAHAGDQLPPFVAVGVEPDDMDKGTRKRYRMANCVYFGCLSYIQIIVIFAGLIIIRKMVELLKRNVSPWSEIDTSGMIALLEPVNTDMSARSRIVNGCHEMIVLGKSNVPNADRRRPIYRVWSGCEEWDRPILDEQ